MFTVKQNTNDEYAEAINQTKYRNAAELEKRELDLTEVSTGMQQRKLRECDKRVLSFFLLINTIK